MMQKGQKREIIFPGASATATVATWPALPAGEEIYDLMPPQTLPYPWFSLIFETLVIVALFYGLWLFYRWITAPVTVTRRQIRQSPQKLAWRAIERLKLSPVWESRQPKEICEIIAQILKNYARDAFAIGIGAAATTDELMASLQAERVTAKTYGRIKELLDICDGIKYTGLERHEKTQEDLIEMLGVLIAETGWKK